MITDKVLKVLTNETLLIDEAKSDPAAFEAIYDFYFARIYNYVRYRVWSPNAADDLTSEIFETVLLKLHTYSAKRGSFSTWLFAIARNKVNYSLRKKKVQRWLSLERFHNLASGEPDFDTKVIENETRQELVMAISQLSERERELIALKFNSGLSNREISGLTGFKESHVAVILHRAIKRLRFYMDTGERQNEQEKRARTV